MMVHGTRIGLPDLLRFFQAFLGLDVSPIRMLSTCPGEIDALSGDIITSDDMDAASESAAATHNPDERTLCSFKELKEDIFGTLFDRGTNADDIINDTNIKDAMK